MSPPEPAIQLLPRAVRDLRRIDGPTRRRIAQALDALAAGAANTNVKALAGSAPWLRLRVGDWRVLYRPRSAVESAATGPGYIVARVVNRRDLLRAVSTLS